MADARSSRMMAALVFCRLSGGDDSGPPGGQRTGGGIGLKVLFTHDLQDSLAHFEADAGVVVEHA